MDFQEYKSIYSIAFARTAEYVKSRSYVLKCTEYKSTYSIARTADIVSCDTMVEWAPTHNQSVFY